MKSKKIYLDADTFNNPTEEMLEAMRNTKIVGDENYPEESGRGDKTIYELEQLAAKKLGKESALFVLNGTFANLLAIFTHCEPGDKIILEKGFHMYYAEMEGIKTICRIEPIYIESNKGIPDFNNIKSILSEDVSLICLENPYNRAGGIITPPRITKSIYELIYNFGIPIHLDGARIFNASISLGIDASEFTRYVDSVMFCLTKGLGTPVGAILAGTEEFIKKARKNRKLLGGHMRQTGNLAAAGIVALNRMWERLSRDNKNAKILGRKLSEIKDIKIDLDAIQVNKVHINIRRLGISSDEFAKRLRKYNVFVDTIMPSYITFRTHQAVTLDDIKYAVEKIKEIIGNIKGRRCL